MEQLQACYFCGAAEDVPLREVRVTPRRRQAEADGQVSLTLCRSCERKLERVLDGLFENVESRRTAEPSAGRGDATGETNDGSAAIDRVDVGTGRSADEPGSAEINDPLGKPASPGDEPPEDPVDPDDPIGSRGEDDADPQFTARATANGTDALDGVSVTEYNRVMRLLQNREFPMGRSAFVDLATSAYDLAEDTVETVLDAVIEKGALIEQEGELVRPDQERSG